VHSEDYLDIAEFYRLSCFKQSEGACRPSEAPLSWGRFTRVSKSKCVTCKNPIHRAQGAFSIYCKECGRKRSKSQMNWMFKGK
jgi:hypothetical protein